MEHINERGVQVLVLFNDLLCLGQLVEKLVVDDFGVVCQFVIVLHFKGQVHISELVKLDDSFFGMLGGAIGTNAKLVLDVSDLLTGEAVA